MSLIDLADWSDWVKKLKWQLISFKFLAFFSTLILLVMSWLSIEKIFFKTINTAKALKEGGFIDQEGVVKIVTQAQAILYDSMFSHLMIGAAAVLASIVAIKGVSYVVNSNQVTEVVKKLENGDLSNNITRFLPKR